MELRKKYISGGWYAVTAVLSVVFFLWVHIAFSAGLVPCDGTSSSPCDFAEFINLIRNIVNFLIFKVAAPLSAVAFAWAGVLMVTSGGKPEKIRQAKDIFWWVFIGFVVALSAWLIVDTIMSALLKPGFKLS